MTEVFAAVGILTDCEGRVLVAQRPADKICPGKWEFPGGKIEPDETPREALQREMREELGIEILQATHILEHLNEFPGKKVFLDIWLVKNWQGQAAGNEGQTVRWLFLEEVAGIDFLPGIDVILPVLSRALKKTF